MGQDLSMVGAFAHIVLLPLMKNGQFECKEFIDNLTIGTMTVSQSIGVASEVGCVLSCATNLFLGLNGIDGVLG